MPINPRDRQEYDRRRAADLELIKESTAPAEAHSAADAVEAVAEFRMWAESTLVIAEGPLAGQPFRIHDWQYDWLVEAMAPGVREAALSVARKNGKTGVIAAWELGRMVGPLNRPYFRGIVVSVTGLLASELWKAMDHIAKVSRLKGVKMYRTPTPGHIEGNHEAVVDFLAADKSTGHAVGCDELIIDEAGLLGEEKRPLWNACYSSMSARDGRMLMISIRGHSPMFTEVRARRDTPQVVWQEYSCEQDADPSDTAEWHRANPGLASGIKSLNYMRDSLAKALASPQDMVHFRTMELNSVGQPDQEVIVDVADWRKCVVDELPAAEGPCFVGLDLGGAKSFTGAAAYYPLTKRLDVWAGVGGTPTLEARGQADGVGARYVAQARRGELTVYEGWRETPVLPFMEDLFDRLAGSAIEGIAADRYKQASVEDVLDSLDPENWTGYLEWRGQGFRDGNEDVVAFQRAVYGERIQAPSNLLLESAILESQLEYDAAGNLKLDKRRRRGRIDPLSAAVLAVAMGERLRRHFDEVDDDDDDDGETGFGLTTV